MKLISRKTIATSAALMLAACSTTEGEPNPDAGTNVEEKPQFLIHSAVETNGTRMNYFTVVDSVSTATKLDYSKSLELPGRPRLYAAKGVGFFAIGAGESPTITRYELKDGALVAGDSVSFANYGVTSLGAQAVLFVSAKKAYYKDTAQAQIIVWNPTEMTIEKTVKLPSELVKENYATSMSQWASREGEAFFTVGWSAKTYDRVLPGTVLVRINTATDEMTTAADDRCRDLGKTANVDGDLYFFSGVINGLGYTVNGGDNGGQQDCILRVKAGQTKFDETYVGSIDAALGENKVGTIVAVTEDGEAWAQVADTTVTPSAPGTTYSQWYSKGWSWYHLPLATLNNAVRVNGEPGAYSGFTLTSGSSFFVSAAKADYSESSLMDLSSGTATAGVSFPGFVLDVAQIK